MGDWPVSLFLISSFAKHEKFRFSLHP